MRRCTLLLTSSPVIMQVLQLGLLLGTRNRFSSFPRLVWRLAYRKEHLLPVADAYATYVMRRFVITSPSRREPQGSDAEAGGWAADVGEVKVDLHSRTSLAVQP
jgi:hypothetical protein